MHDNGDDAGLDREMVEKLVIELVTNAGSEGISKESLSAAVDSVEELLYSAALWKLWTSGEVTFGWDQSDQDLIVCQAGMKAPVEFQ